MEKEVTNLTSEKMLIRKAFISDYRAAMNGKMDNEKLEKSVNYLLKDDTTGYAANGSLAYGLFYVYANVVITGPGGGSFSGNGGGLFGLGGGVCWGDVYTDNLPLLYANTVSFMIGATSYYVFVNFYDNDSNLLGTFQSGALNVFAGVGGGTGSW
jgi:hypothetical protein